MCQTAVSRCKQKLNCTGLPHTMCGAAPSPTNSVFLAGLVAVLAALAVLLA